MFAHRHAHTHTHTQKKRRDWIRHTLKCETATQPLETTQTQTQTQKDVHGCLQKKEEVCLCVPTAVACGKKQHCMWRPCGYSTWETLTCVAGFSAWPHGTHPVTCPPLWHRVHPSRRKEARGSTCPPESDLRWGDTINHRQTLTRQHT